MGKLYLLIQDLSTNRQFFKYFDSEFKMDKFKRKLKYSKKLIIIEDSREMIFDYDR